MTDNERKELLLKAKPILFNTEMVRAILGGRKTVTRRVLKNQPCEECNSKGSDHDFIKDSDIIEGDTFTGFVCLKCGCGVSPPHGKYPVGTSYIRPQYKEGDILYVRETWRIWKAHRYDADAFIDFRSGGYGTILRFTHGCTDLADRDDYDRFIRKWGVDGKWHPSIHMPKEAARIFLRVTNIRVERLQDMTEEDAFMEGFSGIPWCAHSVYENYPDSPIPCEAAAYPDCPPDPPCNHSIPESFGMDIWDKTIKKSDLDKYGWAVNPWVWAIEFERID